MRSDHIDMGGGAEFDAIRRLLEVWGPQAHGIGDDAAVLDVPRGEHLLVSTDASVEDVHFRAAWLTAEEIGARAAAAALSDLAAMAAKPLGLVIAMTIPDAWRSRLEDLARGIGQVAASVGCPIVGGNISAGEKLSIVTTVFGSAARTLHRNGMNSGDIIFVTGRLGGPGAALTALLADHAPLALHKARFARPVPRIMEALWLQRHGATAAIDISDGLVGDARHLERASGMTISIDESSVPLIDGVSISQAVSSGEEYELLVSVPASATIDTAEFARQFGIPLTAIGIASAAEDVRLRKDVDERELKPAFDHFS